jgi:hypothetical protein
MNPNGNGAAPGPNWQAEAEFWKSKYFEYFLHSAQVTAALAQPYFMENALKQQLAKAQQNFVPTPVPPSPEVANASAGDGQQ